MILVLLPRGNRPADIGRPQVVRTEAALEGRQIVFQGEVDDSVSVPIGLFDSVAENCIENARQKRLRESGITIEVALQTRPHLALSICDNGSPIPESRLATLFQQPIAEAEGMGIGLYQARRQAEAAGFEFSITSNRMGMVEFVLKIRESADQERKTVAEK